MQQYIPVPDFPCNVDYINVEARSSGTIHILLRLRLPLILPVVYSEGDKCGFLECIE